MTEPLPSLAEALEREAGLYEELLALLSEEEAALVKGSGRIVAERLARKDALLAEIALAEESRQAAVKRLAGRPDVRLRDLPAARQGEVARARMRLTAVLPEVAAVGRRVDVLLDRALFRLHHTLEMIRDAAGLAPEYTAGARLVQAPMRMLDGRA